MRDGPFHTQRRLYGTNNLLENTIFHETLIHSSCRYHRTGRAWNGIFIVRIPWSGTSSRSCCRNTSTRRSRKSICASRCRSISATHARILRSVWILSSGKLCSPVLCTTGLITSYTISCLSSCARSSGAPGTISSLSASSRLFFIHIPKCHLKKKHSR